MRILRAGSVAAGAFGLALTLGCSSAGSGNGPIGEARLALDGEIAEPPPPIGSTWTIAERRAQICGAQYDGNPYLKCNFDQGLEAIPEICTRTYRNCDGQQVHLSTTCIGPVRGSAEHHFLASVCRGIAGTLSPDDGDAVDAYPVPDDFDVNAFLSTGTTATLATDPNIATVDFSE